MSLYACRPVFLVNNLHEALIFYQEELGLSVIHQGESYAALERDAITIALYDGRHKNYPTYGNMAAFFCDNLKAIYSEYTQKNTVLAWDLRDVDQFIKHDFAILDPFGNTLIFAQAAE